MKELETNLRELDMKEVANLIVTVTRDDDILADTSLLHGSHGAFEQGLATHLQQAFGLCISQRAQTFSHARC